MRAIAPLVLFAGAVLVAATVGPVGAAAPVPKHLMKEAEGDKAKLQGKWKVTSIQLGGKNIGADILPQGFEMLIEFRGDQLLASANGPGNNQTTTAVVKYDTTAKRFTTTQTKSVDRNGAGGAPKDEKDEVFGYSFDGDKLLLTVSPGKPAPDPTKPGDSDVVLVLTRVK